MPRRPRRIAYDNLKCAVIQVGKGKNRRLNKRFYELRAWYLFETRFCNIAKGNEKGDVENACKRSERTYLSPQPHVDGISQLAGKLFDHCRNDLNRKGPDVHGGKTVGELLEEERPYLLPLQSERFEACCRRSTFVDGHALVRVDTVHYSAPVEWAYHPCVIETFVDQIRMKKIGWILDADIRGYFDAICHNWMVRFLEYRIADRRMLHLFRKWLKAGVIENGIWTARQEGSPQGASISPLMANVYLHYVLDLWVQWWRKHVARGEVIIVRWADDFVMGFQYEAEARRFLKALRDRFRKSSLELHPDKTCLIRFGRFARRDVRRFDGRTKPETFDFLGFTHFCGV